MRPRAALAGAGCLALLATGCPRRTPPPDLSLEPARLLAQVREAQAPLLRVKGEARLRVKSPGGSGTVRQLAAAERPDRVYLAELDFLGNPAAVLVASGGRFWLYDARAGVLYRGAATPANLARLVPLPLSAEELAAILLGSAPLLAGGTPVSATADGGTVRLRLEEGAVSEDLWVGEHAAVEKAFRAVGTGAPKRLAAAPDIPTMVEQGLPGYLVEGWFAVIGPAKMQGADVARINAAFAAAFATPEVREAMAKQGNTINVTTPEQAASFFRSELAKYARLVKKAGVELQ